jgi:tetratricopeptide (TPR) repeat protein
MLWLAQANVQMKDFGRAEPMLDMVRNKIQTGKAPEKYERDLDLIYADFYIKQKSYASAVEYLNLALDYNLKRTMKTRCMFILAQIHQNNGELSEATKLYSQVIKRNPAFEMEFNAKINMARCYIANSGEKEFIVKKLNKMLKDEKNKEQFDQVHYALSEIYLKEGDTATAIDYLAKSVATSHSNNYQKAISALALADIYFGRKVYPKAQAYYDSTMRFLPKDYPTYKELSEKTATLTDLVKNLQIIQREDSLQRLAAMSESERMAVIQKIIAQVVEEEKKKAEEERLRQESRMFENQNQNADLGTPAGGGTGAWYFYNPSTMANGYTTFIRKWGKRVQEDLWFLSDKTLAAGPEESVEDTVEVGSDTTAVKDKKEDKKALTNKNPKYYLKDIPFKPEQLEASTNKIIQAYYNVGFIYLEGLRDYEQSVNSFETLLQRFPANKYNVATCYELYQIYTDLENKEKADFYKNLILDKYPETDFAKLLVNPNYYKEIKTKKQEVAGLYEDTYKAFTNQQYYMVINNADLAFTTYKSDTSLFPKFAYLKALSLGKIEVVDSMIVAMQGIVKRYPKSDIRPLAQNVLTFLNKQTTPEGAPLVKDSAQQVQETAVKIYTFNAEAVHFYVLIVDNDKNDVEALKIKISDFNSKFHDLENLQVNSLLLDGNQEMITISNFENSEKAMNYYISIKDNDYIFTRLKQTGDYAQFVISAENYPIFYRNKNIANYLRFFEKNYPVQN